MAIKTSIELAEACKKVATKYKTLYVMGCYGAPMTDANKKRYCDKKSNASRVDKINNASSDTFGFDCSCLIKGLLWGWDGDKNARSGGAIYASNNVPDINANTMITKCTDVSTDFSNIEVGEVVWMSGHIGVYIGDGLAVEATPKWKNNVQITAVLNIGKKAGYNGRTWTKHGKLPYVEYPKPTPAETEKTITVKLPELKKGSKGETVKALQRMLHAMGYKLGSKNPFDGDFGKKTDDAVRAYQEANGLYVDGIVGAKTWAKLLGA